MVQSVTANYTTQESKNVGAKPKLYVAIMRATKTLASDDYSSGAHTNTEFTGGNLQLQGGQSSGNWESAVLDSAHLTPNIIYDKITWTETLNGGTVTVKLRSAVASGSVSGATYATYTNATLDHTERFRYYQIKIELEEGASSPTVSSVVIRHKALIPKTDYIDLGALSYGIDIDFFNSYAGEITIVVDNSAHQFEKNQSASYIYNLRYYYEPIELWMGFELADTSIEWLQQYLGEIESISVNSGPGANYTATILSRDLLYRVLNNTYIGRPASDGTPQPYMSGKRYRVIAKETDTDNYVYTLYSQQAISSIDAVYIRDTINQKWVTAPSNTPNAGAKTITFDADPQAEVSADITISAVDHSCDIIQDIFDNELSLSSDDYNSTALTTIKNRTSTLSVGVAFDNIPSIQAINELMKTLDGAIYVENGVITVKNFWPAITSTQSFGEGVVLGTSMIDSIAEVQNTVSVYYGDYDDDKTKYLELTESDSVSYYGNLTKDKFDFRYSAPVSITSVTAIEEIIGHWLYHQTFQFENYVVGLPLEILRTEIFDVIDLTITKHNLSATEMLVLKKELSYGSYEGSLTTIRYPEVEWMFFSDSGDTTELYYFVDDSSSDVDYQSYFW